MTTVVSPGAGGRIDLGLQGSAVVITGAGSGIGAAAPRLLAAAGVSVVLVGGRGEMLRQTAGAIEEAGGRALCLPADLADADSPARIIASALPAIVLGKHYWGGWWLLILFATINSVIAVSIACTNTAVRFLYGMSRGGALPASLLKIHPRFKMPSNAIILQTCINIALGLILPLLIGVANVYNVTGTWFTFALAFVYVMANIGLCVFYRREHPDEFSWFKHLIVPGIGSVALIVVCYYSVVPLPPWPVSASPFVVLGWLLVGAVVMLIIFTGAAAAGPESWRWPDRRWARPTSRLLRSGSWPRTSCRRPTWSGDQRAAVKARSKS